MDVYVLCRERFPAACWERNFSFARHTTIACGGYAQAAVSPCCTEEAAELLAFFRRERIPVIYLGAGANVLPSDGVFEGVVMRFSRLTALYGGDSVFAGAGVTGGALVRFACLSGLGGYEPLAGIPMTVGGAVTMNAGVREGHIGDLVERVVGVEKGKIHTFSAGACAFAEKSSLFQSGIAVTGVYLRASKKDRGKIARDLEAFRSRRRRLPKGRSMGCVFVNPPDISAGALIEACGLKGMRAGGAVVSEVHANFILNEGGCAADVARLIDAVKEEVRRQTGIILTEEVKRLPCHRPT